MMRMSLTSTFAFAALVLSMPYAGLTQPQNKDVIVQMFEWTWNSITGECWDFLGPAGYGFVQLSPAQEHVLGPEWWTDYQPVSYSLISKRGSRAQFQNMINVCHDVGVKVIADTIWNHMAGAASGFGVAGSRFTHYDYPGIYQYQDFHHCGVQPGDNIRDYKNATEVWTCQLSGLADLATETEYVRQRLADYANDLLSLGVDGLRLDASKHINPDDIANITSRLTSRTTVPYITQEVIYGDGEAVTPDMYIKNGGVQEFRYTTTLKYEFLQGSISVLQNFDNWGWVPDHVANVFVSNHDTERNSASLNAYSPSNAYTLASVFSLAHPYGMPTILSSYSSFPDKDAGAPNGGTGNCSDTVNVKRWFCQHRWTAIAGMVGFRNVVGSAPLTGWVSPSSQRIAFARGTLGFVAINNQDSAWDATFSTGLPGGSYCNVIDGVAHPDGCSGTSFWIGVDGSLTVTIGPYQAIAVHSGARGKPWPDPDVAQHVSVLFYETATTTVGENIFVVGSVRELGHWDPSNAIPLDPVHYPVWGATVYLPPNTVFQYKFIRKKANGKIVWESNPNRKDETPASGVQSIMTTWR